MENLVRLLYRALPSKNIDNAMNEVFGDGWDIQMRNNKLNFEFVLSYMLDDNGFLAYASKTDFKRLEKIIHFEADYADYEFAYNLAKSYLETLQKGE